MTRTTSPPPSAVVIAKATPADAPGAPGAPGSSAIPTRMLLALIAVVLAAHAWVLDSLPDVVRPGAAPPSAPLVARMIEPPTTPDIAAANPAPLARFAARTARPKAPPAKAAKNAQNAENTPENTALEQEIRRRIAIDSIATTPAMPAELNDAPPAIHSPPSPATAAGKTATLPVPGTAESGPSPEVPVTAQRNGAAPAADAVAAAPLRIPQPARLRYQVRGQVKGLGYNVNAQLVWSHDGERYDTRQEISVFLLGSRVQTSSGRITAQGLAPERFSDKARTEQAAHFDQAQGLVIFSANTPTTGLLPGAQDRLSVMVQLAALVGGDPQRYPAGSSIAIQTVGPRDAEIWSFAVEGMEILQLAGTEHNSLHLSRAPRRDYDMRIDLWLSPALDYLPARVRLTQHNGDFVDLQLSGSEKP